MTESLSASRARCLPDAGRPNILLIVVDDMGYSDIGPFGGEIDTPNLDELARSGMLFTDFHTAASCSPTRSMLFSGTDNHLAGVGSMGETITPNQRGKKGYEGYLSDRVVSIATLLRDAGYYTAMTGKWHLGEELEQDPFRRGFQKAYTMLVGGTSHIAATILEASQTPHPGTSYKGRKVEPLRGRSLFPVLSGKANVVYEDDTAVSWELFGLRAVRKGDFKLLWMPEPFGTDDWQLYDLARDPGETNDLSEGNPELRSEMIEIWNRYSQETGVILPSKSPLSR